MTSEVCKWGFSKRMNHIPKSFIREILKVTSQKDVISFAGGLPNPETFPVEGIKKAANDVLSEDGKIALQYSISQGYLPLREYLSKWYLSKGLEISPEEILITNGSQQGLDLIGKVFIDEGDEILLERPSYLGAIQSFSAYLPNFSTVDVNEDGVDLEQFLHLARTKNIKFFYTVPTFQNPSGIAYSLEKRERLAAYAKQHGLLIVEDNPYGEINFTGLEFTPIKKWAGDHGILLGSFSKIISPGMRLGWIAAHKAIIAKVLVAKEASDLHSNHFSQCVVHRYLIDNNIQEHICTIVDKYKQQKDRMIDCIKKYFPADVVCFNPKGGMFIWVTLPERMNSRDILEEAQKRKIVFVPGDIFYIDHGGRNTMRLNFSNSNDEEIEKGISILGEIIAARLVE
jgi:2-aminoadipate transaminase